MFNVLLVVIFFDSHILSSFPVFLDHASRILLSLHILVLEPALDALQPLARPHPGDQAVGRLLEHHDQPLPLGKHALLQGFPAGLVRELQVYIDQDFVLVYGWSKTLDVPFPQGVEAVLLEIEPPLEHLDVHHLGGVWVAYALHVLGLLLPLHVFYPLVLLDEELFSLGEGPIGSCSVRLQVFLVKLLIFWQLFVLELVLHAV